MASATLQIEIELDVSGEPYGSDPSVGDFFGGYDDLDVTGAFADALDKRSKPFQRRRVDILAGLDRNARAIVLSNLRMIVEADAIVEALDTEATDYAADRADDLRDQRRDDELAKGLKSAGVL